MARLEDAQKQTPPRRRTEQIGNLLLGLAMLALLAAVGALLVERRFTLISEVALVVAAVFLVAFVILEPSRTRTWITSRQVRYGSNAVVMTLALLVTLGVANFLADLHSYRVDVTADRRLSLSSQTVDLLRTMEGPIRVLVFSNSSAFREQAADLLLDQYRAHHPDLEVEFHDPEVEPSKAAEWGVTDAWRPTLFLLYQGRQEKIHAVGEREISSALLRLSRETQPGVYFVTGHGERGLEDVEGGGLSLLAERLQAQGIRVSSLNLLAVAAVPSDADALVIAAPRRVFSEQEIGQLAAYADGGGSLMVMLDPALERSERSPLEAWLLERWGVDFRADLVVDPVSFIYPLPTIPVAASYGNSPLAEGLRGVGTYFIDARSVAQAGDMSAAGLFLTPVVRTSSDSWGETSQEQLAQIPDAWPTYDESEDAVGPLNLAVTVEEIDGDGRLVAFGDSDFCSNLFVEDLANGDLALNALHWLTEDEELISLRPPAEADRYVMIQSNLLGNALFAILVILVPLAVLGIGGVVLLARRRRR